MKSQLAELLAHLELEKLEVNMFRGDSRDIGSERVFGGQVLAQALRAALGTVRNRQPHSLHAYFLRPGDVKAPIIYNVDRARDGLSFSMRRVVAVQHGHQIFNLSVSFHREEEGLEHQFEMPKVPSPEALPDNLGEESGAGEGIPPRLRRFFAEESPFDFRFVETPDMRNPQPTEPVRHVWFRPVDSLPDDDALHRTLLAYVSDFHLISTVTNPHAIAFSMGKLQMASLDHAMWFHCAPRLDDWLLYAMDSPRSSSARGFARGQIYTRAGKLIASTAQEGLIRVWSEEVAGRS